MKALVTASVLAAVAAAQVTIMPTFGFGGLYPSLMVALIVARTLSHGSASGMRWAIGGGLLVDLMAPGAIGPHALGTLAAAYAVGFIHRRFDADAFVIPVAAGILGAATHDLVLLALEEAGGRSVGLTTVLSSWTLGASVLTGLLVVPCLWWLRRRQTSGEGNRGWQ